MGTRVGVNGFGRMGRLALRAAWGWPELEFSHVNELKGDATTGAHLVAFDSIHGRWDRDVRGDGGALSIDGQAIGYEERPLVSVYAWYDNEWGYANRLAELTRTVAASLPG